MSKWAAFAGSSGALAGTSAVVVAAAIGAGLYINANRAEPVPVAEPVAVAAQPEPQAPAEPEAPALNPPSIDEVRVEADGLTVIAGRAAPGSKVAVFLDGAENTETTTDDGGSFAAITILPPSPKAQVLTVVQRVGLDEIASVDEVILAPQAQPAPVAETQAPEAVAEVEPEAATEDVAHATPDTVEAPKVSAAPVTPAVTDTPPQDTVAVAPSQTPEPSAPVLAEASETPASQDPAPGTEPKVATAETPSVEPETPTTEVTVLKSTADGVEVLINTPPEALDNIAIDSISYSDQGDVELAGRAQPDADAVRVYVNNAPIADIDVSEDGNWRGELPQIDTGTYTLRVDELDGEGQVTSRIETPFRREDPELLAQIDTEDAPATQIIVQTGNTLWAIARERYGEGTLYVEVFEANRDRIRNPDLIFPGQVFALPN